MKKQILLIWDLDGPLGQINSTYPYNFNFDILSQELKNVEEILDILASFGVKSTFAITGISAENGVYPYVFPDLIRKISAQGHEIASHSWRHEWIPLFKKEQIVRSIQRSKRTLEKIFPSIRVNGFVPPHNRPMSWIARGAVSFGDRGLFLPDSISDSGKLISVLKKHDYQWIRISFQDLWQKLGLKKKNITGRLIKRNGFLILENHYTGFDEAVRSHILNTSYPSYTLSAHPLMFSYEDKKENKKELLDFLNVLQRSDQEIEFITPSSLL